MCGPVPLSAICLQGLQRNNFTSGFIFSAEPLSIFADAHQPLRQSFSFIYYFSEDEESLSDIFGVTGSLHSINSLYKSFSSRNAKHRLSYSRLLKEKGPIPPPESLYLFIKRM